jgi:fructokinase
MTTNQSPAICVMGENLVDILVHADNSVTGVPGGGPFNVARTIARLGQESILFSGLSMDAFGSILRSELLADGVSLADPAPVSKPSTLAIVDLTGPTPSYFFHLNNTAAFATEEVTTLKIFNQLENVKGLYFGTLGLSVEPMASTGEALVNAASEDTLVVIDPNCRPSAIDDQSAYRSRLLRLFPRTDIVKVSTEDLDYLDLGSSHEQGARAILDAGAQCVVVTDGPGYVHVHFADETISLEVPKIEAVDTVGAGDSLVGGTMAWFVGQGFTRSDVSNHQLVAQAVAAGIRVASTTCTRAGANPPLLSELAGAPEWQPFSN